MSDFERDVTGYRHVETVYGDSMKRLALRELGDASAWVDIANLNGLVPPYIVDDEASLKPGVVLSGAVLMVPAPVAMQTVTTNAAAVFGQDIGLTKKLIQVENGDIALFSGVPNLKQALEHRIAVAKRDLMFHPEYGCWVHEVLGAINGPTAGQLAAMYVKSALLEDNRVSEVTQCVGTVSGDSISVEAEVVPISGIPISLSVVV